MKKIYKTLLFVMIGGSVVGQARLVLRNNPFVVLNGGTAVAPINIVLGNSATNAITWDLTGGGAAQANGGIISEGEGNIIKCNIGTANPGAGDPYNVPFTASSTGPAIPVSVAITTAGTGAGNIKLSTYRPTGTQDANLPYPTGVTNLNSADPDVAGTGGANNAYNVLDRFWLIDANGYNANLKPVGSMTFNYVDAEHSAGSNAITEGSLKAQRYRAATNDWENYAPTGTQAAGSHQGQVSGITFAAADFESVWVLVDNRAPLPIELLVFKGDCEDGQRNLYWVTSSETNNNFFTIEKSVDGKTFTEIATIASLAPSGNSTTKLKYNYIDKNNIVGDYYRLKQTDYDGKFEYSSIIYNKCEEDENSKPASADIFPNPSNGVVHVLLTGYENQSVQIRIMNSIGQQVAERMIQGDNTTQKETFSLTDQAKGIYYVTIVTEKETITKKVINQY